MRKIEFRLWNQSKKEMFYDISTNGIIATYHEPFSDPLTKYQTSVYGSRSDKLMQFIGHTDKNDIDIYEGDWVLAEIGDSRSHFYCTVVYNETSAAFMLLRHTVNGRAYFKDVLECEVIGNIYEHPSLKDLINK